MENKASLSFAMASPQTDLRNTELGGEDISGKVENDANPITSPNPWDVSSNGFSKGSLSNLADTPAALAVANQMPETQGSVALKVATTVLQPICLGEMVPIHLQMAGAAGPQLGQMGAAPYFLTGQGPGSLPLVLDQQVLQHLGSSVMPQTANCPGASLQNNVLCQNTSLTFGLPPVADQKTAVQSPDSNLLSLLQNPAFSAILQDLFPPPTGPSSCQSPGSVATDPFGFPVFPSHPLAHPYTSPLAPLVPPATLLVPYPVVIPLPVPLPIPLPIPIPVPQTSEDVKGAMPKPVCTESKGTQTYAKDATSCQFSPGRVMPLSRAHTASPPSPSATEGEALDLSIRACPLEPKKEQLWPQDNVLDLSVAGLRRTAPLPCGSAESARDEGVLAYRSSPDAPGSSLSLGLLRPVECTQSVDSKLLSGLASLEFSRHHKWVLDGSAGGAKSVGRETSLSRAGNLEFLSTSQTAKVIVSVKDAIPAILCGKLKGISGVSTKNFSIKRDRGGRDATSLQQLYGSPSRSQGEPQNPLRQHDMVKKAPKNRAIKLKKVSTQEIHFLPIKKQRLAAFLPTKK